MLLEASAGGDAGDDSVSASWAQAPTTLVEKQRRAVACCEPVAALLEPVAERLTELLVNWNLRTRSPFPKIRKDSFAGGESHLIEVQRDGLRDPRAGVERNEPERPIARRGACLDRAQVSDLGPFTALPLRPCEHLHGDRLDPVELGRPESPPSRRPCSPRRRCWRRWRWRCCLSRYRDPAASGLPAELFAPA
jgi:hypothetical protein